MLAPILPRPTMPSSEFSATPAPFDRSRPILCKGIVSAHNGAMPDPPASTTPYCEPADVLVIFGITGDLARKMTFRALYRLERRKRLECPIIGVGRRSDWGHDDLRSRAHES